MQFHLKNSDVSQFILSECEGTVICREIKQRAKRHNRVETLIRLARGNCRVKEHLRAQTPS